MKILFNCLNLEKGGTERVISILANNFSLENDISILMLRKNKIKYELNKNIKLFSVLDLKSKKNLKVRSLFSKISVFQLFSMKYKIKEINPDIIISFLPEPSLKLMLIKKIDKKIRNIPTIISIRNSPKVEYRNKLIYVMMKYLYKKVDKLILQTNEAFEYFRKIIEVSKLMIIPNPIDNKFLIKEQFKGKRKMEIVTVGRLVSQKNHKLLIDAFFKVFCKYKNVKLKIYGSGKLEKELKIYVNSLNLNENIIFEGEVDDIEKAIYKSKIFVLSSNYEGMPNALMEAMSLGLPCISTDCSGGGPKMLIENNINGILVPTNDCESLYNAILKLLEDDSMCNKLSESAFLSSKRYESSNICNEWKLVIKNILKKNN